LLGWLIDWLIDRSMDWLKCCLFLGVHVLRFAWWAVPCARLSEHASTGRCQSACCRTKTDHADDCNCPEISSAEKPPTQSKERRRGIDNRSWRWGDRRSGRKVWPGFGPWRWVDRILGVAGKFRLGIFGRRAHGFGFTREAARIGPRPITFARLFSHFYQGDWWPFSVNQSVNWWRWICIELSTGPGPRCLAIQ